MADKEPGRSFFYMWSLVGAFQPILAPTPVDRDLVLSIMWEEFFFNNGRQEGGGTGQGFGQVEPANFVFLDADAVARYPASVSDQQKSQKARSMGYAVAKLPDVIDKRRAATDVTDDTMGAKLTCALIRHLFESHADILKAYAGYFWAQGDDKAKRLAIIDHWTTCATRLRALAITSAGDVYAHQDDIANALGQAKGFSNVRAKFMAKLFPGQGQEQAPTIDPSI